jgi:molybdenum cofactor cytidylyltransferase
LATGAGIARGGGEGFEAIVLAAGAGSRFGGAKLSAPWRGGALVDGALAAAYAAPVRRVTVVTGADPAVAGAVQTWTARRPGRPEFRLVHAQAHAEGMGASLRTGIDALAPDCAGVFVFLGDMPLVPPEIALRLAQAVRAGALAAAPTFQGRRGHPVLFARPLLPRLAEAAGDSGARDLLASLRDHLVLIEATNGGVLADVDAPRDLPP